VPSTTTGGSSASAAVPSSRGTEAQPILTFLSARLRRGSAARNGGSGELQRHAPSPIHAIPQELCLCGCGLPTAPSTFVDNKTSDSECKEA